MWFTLCPFTQEVVKENLAPEQTGWIRVAHHSNFYLKRNSCKRKLKCIMTQTFYQNYVNKRSMSCQALNWAIRLVKASYVVRNAWPLKLPMWQTNLAQALDVASSGNFTRATLVDDHKLVESKLDLWCLLKCLKK